MRGDCPRICFNLHIRIVPISGRSSPKTSQPSTPTPAAPGWGCWRALAHPGKGCYCLPPFTAHDSRHNLRPGSTLSREAAGRVCLWALAHPGKGCYCLPPITAHDSRHNLRPGTALRRGAPGRGCLWAPAHRREGTRTRRCGLPSCWMSLPQS